MASELAQLERTIAYFRGFWALIESGPNSTEVSELDQILSRFSDFWAMSAQDGDVIGDQGQNGAALGPELGSDDDDGPAENYSSMHHFAQMFILESEQRYLRRTLQINVDIMQNQRKKLREARSAVKVLRLEHRSLVRARKRRETGWRHKIEGGFVQFWRGIEKQEMAGGEEPEEPEYPEYPGGLFPLAQQ